jgi:YbgC/YbaW family acyl-CoA thioester hydrolase
MNKTPSSNHKVRFNDCDLFGHLNNARYLDYMLDAREDHLKDHYQFDMTESYKNGTGWVIGSHDITYVRPAVYNEMVTIQSRLLHADNYVLQVEMIMTDANSRHVKAVMRTKFVPVNMKSGRLEAHKPEFLEWVLSLIDHQPDAKVDLQERAKQIQAELKASH